MSLAPTKVAHRIGLCHATFSCAAAATARASTAACLPGAGRGHAHALTFLQQHPAVDSNRIAGCGIELRRGAVAVYAGGTDERVAAVISNGGWG